LWGFNRCRSRTRIVLLGKRARYGHSEYNHRKETQVLSAYIIDITGLADSKIPVLPPDWSYLTPAGRITLDLIGGARVDMTALERVSFMPGTFD
jgi:hypothetical protein